jgi:hypothetical protein
MRIGPLAAVILLGGAAAPAAEPIHLKVLYAGNPGSDREKDFVAFLGQHFAKVTPTDLAKLDAAAAKGHDVVIIDWTSIYPRDKDGKIDNKAGELKMPPRPKLGPDYAKATVLIGAAGGTVREERPIKIDWL